MEREDRATVGTFHAPGPWSERVELGEAAAHHAHVKRLAVGDIVQLSSGAGRRVTGAIVELAKRTLIVSIDMTSVEDVPAPPAIELWVPIGDRDRMLLLAEKSVELGATVWQPVLYARSRSVSPRGEGEAFHARVRLRMISALEQCGTAWLPEVRAGITLEGAFGADAGVQPDCRLLLDAAGDPIADVARAGVDRVRIALGPEGGLNAEECKRFAQAGWRGVSLGSNVLRFETAGIAALAIVGSILR